MMWSDNKTNTTKMGNSRNTLFSKIIAHRGASHDAPENTVASAELGWEQQADGLELDVYLSKDGHLVAMHDSTVMRTARVRGNIEDFSLEELKRLDVGLWKSDRFAGEQIPVLDELLRTVPSGKRAFVEIKTKQDVSADLARALGDAKMANDQVVLICFDYAILQVLKRRLPQYKMLWLVGRPGIGRHASRTEALKKLIQSCHDAGFDGLDLSEHWPIDRSFVEQVRGAKLELGIWTVDSVETARSLVSAGVDYITTNRPGWIREKLEKSD